MVFALFYISASSDAVDIIFAVDLSNLLDSNHFGTIQTFIIQTAELLHISPDDVQIGVTKFASDVYQMYPLNLFRNRKQVQVMTEGLKRMGISVGKDNGSEFYITSQF